MSYYESNLYLLDYRCNPNTNTKLKSLINISTIESYKNQTFFITNIKSNPIDNNKVYVSSNNKIYEIDVRIPRTSSSSSFNNTCTI